MTTFLDDRRAPARRPAPPTTPAARSEQLQPETVLAAIGAGAAAVLWMWWRATPSVNGLGDWLTNAGRITGLLAGYAVVVLLALMARVPALDGSLGSDRMARWHSRGGRYTVGLVAAHGVLITWGYAVTAHTNVVSQGASLLTSYPDVLMATVAGLLLVGVGIVSARAARRRMSYETWHFLHFYTYLAVALAFSHQFSTGAQFISDRPARVVWSLMYAGVGGCIVWFRWVTPVRRALRHRMRVLEVRPEAPGVVSVVIGGRHLDELAALPGQFFRWRFLGRGLWWAANPYSLSAPPHPDRLRITVKRLGDHSAALARVRPGTRVVAEGPYGGFTAQRRRRRKVLLIAGGVGITPMRALFETLPADSGELTLVYRAASEREVVFRTELEAIARRRGARLHVVTGHRRELGGDPLSEQALRQNVPDLREHDVFVCGPEPMTENVVRALRRAGVGRRHIHRESFAF